MIFTRETMPATIRRGMLVGLAEHAVDPEAHAHLATVGLEVDVGGAILHRLGDDRVHELDHRRVLGGLADVGDRGALLLLLLLHRLGHRVVEPAHAADQAGDVVRRRHHRAHLVSSDAASGRPAPARSPDRPWRPAGARRRRSRSVRRRSGARPAPRSGSRPTGRGGRSGGRRGSSPKRSAIARASWSPVSAPASSSTCSGRAAGGPPLLDGRVHAFARYEAQLGDHVGDEPAPPPRRCGWRESGAVVVGCRSRGRLGSCRDGTQMRHALACLLAHRASATSCASVSSSTKPSISRALLFLPTITTAGA